MLKMFTILVCLVILVTPISAAVAKQAVNSCSPTEFACGDGGCVSAELVCDGRRDCADGLDECSCDGDSMSLLSQEPIIHRSRRQASSRCRKDQWQCRDGSCISFDGECDGIVDCADGSDETHALCRKSVCQRQWFRCTYGACVDGTAPCNGVQECADNSDELLPRCRNETEEVRGRFTCLDGSTILAVNHCDGTRDCRDGSDETVRSCAARTCPSYFFQCAYGACVDSDANCNQVQDCADGSDEAAELCDKSGTAPVSPVKPEKGSCVLPPHPDHGIFVTNVPNGRPGEAYNSIAINITCHEGYGVQGPRSISCFNGWWFPEQMPKCISLCHLLPHPSVEYNCLVTEGGVNGIRPCKEYEPHGTVVSPRCQTPNYYSPTELRYMQCIDGTWDRVAICTPGLTKNGTNITIIVKDTVEVYVSDIKYVVPITNSHIKPVVPFTRPITYKPTNVRPITNIPTSYKPNGNNSGTDTFSGTFESVSNTPIGNTINTDTNNNNYSGGINNNDDNDINTEIDLIDWRMGVPDNHSTKIPSNLNKYTKKKTNNAYYIDQNKFSSFVYNSTRITSTTDSNDYKQSSMDVRNREPESNEYYGRSRTSSITTSTTNRPKSSVEGKVYTSRNNNTNIYFNIANSSVNINTDGYKQD